MPAPRQRSLLTATLLIAGLLSAAVPAHAAPASSTEAAVVAAKDSLARELAVSLTSPAWASTLRSAVAAGHTDVLALTAGRSLAGAAAAANRAVLAAKGLPT
ncbi:MAG: hypothetical protein QOI35_2497, partial [Cryptosporangiaceae bacterium]|nr:hypothetical protein [Cryptosporangiaceae bacterium]